VPAFPGMRITLQLLGAIIAAVLAAGSLHSARIPPTSTPEEIARLDSVIQQRFLMTGPFGISRVALVSTHGIRPFIPATPAERDVVTLLKSERYDVGFFLLGRLALPSSQAVFPFARLRSEVQGPAFITVERPAELPTPESLLEVGSAALKSFAAGEGYDVRSGDWTVAMRPLRASTERCIACHNSMGEKVKLGDALGVAMYVYRRTTEETARPGRF